MGNVNNRPGQRTGKWPILFDWLSFLWKELKARITTWSAFCSSRASTVGAPPLLSRGAGLLPSPYTRSSGSPGARRRVVVQTSIPLGTFAQQKRHVKRAVWRLKKVCEKKVVRKKVVRNFVLSRFYDSAKLQDVELFSHFRHPQSFSSPRES